MDKTKSFEISKQVVWKAYQRVKANKGAAGIDKESIMDFEQNLKDNLYKLWNRMSSGSYLPPPVKAVEIVDVTGAGDTVISTLALATASGLPIDNAITLANLAASLVVARFGAASVTLSEMLDSLREQSLNNKKQHLDDIDATLRRHRMQGRRVVFTNGCFDLFHAGHLATLRKAAEFGEVLVVGINSDGSIKSIKGPGRPIVPESQRVEMIAALSFVDYVLVFDEETPLNLIKAVRPDILVKGEDWRGKKVVGEEVVTARGGRVEFVKLLAGLSTTEIINRIRAWQD